MKRIVCLAALMALSSPACARDSYSFNFHGHRIHVEASRNCRSLSCVSVSVPGVGNWRNGRRDDADDVTSRAPTPAPSNVAPAASANAAPVQPALAPAPPQVQAVPPAQPAPVVQAPPAPTRVQQQPSPAPSVAAIPPVQSTPAAPPAPAVPAAQPPVAAVAPPAPATPAVPPAAVAATPPAPPVAAPATPPAQTPPAAAAATPPAAAQPATPVAQPTAAAVATSPLGDWQTEAKTGLVRIESCGGALCGYMIDAATNVRGETILVNMKPKAGSQWSGNVLSRSSGNSYYGTITLKEANTLRVEACALGQFWCSGNNWTRVAQSSAQPGELATSHQPSPEPHS
jgi:uncharacterized protein (DUF2147 family)